MLKSLSIENIAVIEKAEIAFSPGLNVLTGETGAGKSIVVDAINAVLGERTSKELVRHGADNAKVTAIFENVNDETLERLRELGMDTGDGELMFTRSISAAGKSSCRINGALCTATMLRDIGVTLVNIHGQHDGQALLNPDAHYRFIDFLGTEGLADYQQVFRELLAIRRRLKQLTSDADDKDRRLELLNYEISELEAADIKPGEREALKEKRNIILNAQSVMNAVATVRGAIVGDDEAAGIETLLASAQKEMEGIAALDEALAAIYTQLGDLLDKTEAVKDAAEAKLSAMDFSEHELETIEERLDLLYRFSNKYGETEEEMLAYLENARQRRDSIVHSDEELMALNDAYDAAYVQTMAAAERLSNSRKQIARKLEQAVTEELKQLDMPKIKFITSFERGKLSANGYDRVEFLISTNPGEPPKPLTKIVSGGELSRIMLAIKKIIAFKDSVQTLIFDEVDTGVSGKTSRKIGFSLKDVSAHAQVICVTHAAQIASLADTHLLIRKDYKNDKTYTSVSVLSYEERKQELARIMGGLEITDTLLKSAEELLGENNMEEE